MKRMQVTWSIPEVKGTAPQPRQNHTAVIVNNKMYVFGGTTTNKKLLGDMNVLDLESLTWSIAESTGHPPSARYGHSCVVYQKLLLVFGGFDGTKRLNDVYKYDTIKNVWIQPDVKGEKPDARSSHCAAIINNRMVVYGGVISGKVTGNMFVLNLNNWTWNEAIPKGPTPKARFNHAAVALGNLFYIAGGQAPMGKFNDVHYFDPETLLWTEIKAGGLEFLNSSNFTMNTIGNRIFVFRGENASDMFVLTLESVDTPTAWSKPVCSGQIQPKQVRAGHTTIQYKNNLVVFGGTAETDQIWLLDISSILLSAEKDKAADVVEEEEDESDDKSVSSDQIRPSLRESANAIKHKLTSAVSKVNLMTDLTEMRPRGVTASVGSDVPTDKDKKKKKKEEEEVKPPLVVSKDKALLVEMEKKLQSKNILKPATLNDNQQQKLKKPPKNNKPAESDTEKRKFRCYFENEVRLLDIESDSSLEGTQKTLEESLSVGQLYIKFIDKEKDMVVIRDQNDFEAAIELLTDISQPVELQLYEVSSEQVWLDCHLQDEDFKLSVTPNITYITLTKTLHEDSSLTYTHLRFKDDEGDMIEIKTDEELQIVFDAHKIAEPVMAEKTDNYLPLYKPIHLYLSD